MSTNGSQGSGGDDKKNKRNKIPINPFGEKDISRTILDASLKFQPNGTNPKNIVVEESSRPQEAINFSPEDLLIKSKTLKKHQDRILRKIPETQNPFLDGLKKMKAAMNPDGDGDHDDIESFDEEKLLTPKKIDISNLEGKFKSLTPKEQENLNELLKLKSEINSAAQLYFDKEKEISAASKEISESKRSVLIDKETKKLKIKNLEAEKSRLEKESEILIIEYNEKLKLLNQFDPIQEIENRLMKKLIIIVKETAGNFNENLLEKALRYQKNNIYSNDDWGDDGDTSYKNLSSPNPGGSTPKAVTLKAGEKPTEVNNTLDDQQKVIVPKTGYNRENFEYLLKEFKEFPPPKDKNILSFSMSGSDYTSDKKIDFNNLIDLLKKDGNVENFKEIMKIIIKDNKLPGTVHHIANHNLRVAEKLAFHLKYSTDTNTNTILSFVDFLRERGKISANHQKYNYFKLTSFSRKSQIKKLDDAQEKLITAQKELYACKPNDIDNHLENLTSKYKNFIDTVKSVEEDAKSNFKGGKYKGSRLEAEINVLLPNDRNPVNSVLNNKK